MNSLISYILVPELVYKQYCFFIYLYQSWCINSLGSYLLAPEQCINSLSSYILVPELVYEQSCFLYTCTRAGV